MLNKLTKRNNYLYIIIGLSLIVAILIIISIFIFNSDKFSDENCNNLKCDKNIILPTDVDKSYINLNSCDVGRYPCATPCTDCIKKANEGPLYKNNCNSDKFSDENLIKFYIVKTAENTKVNNCLLLPEQIDGEEGFSIGEIDEGLSCPLIKYKKLCIGNKCKWTKGSHDVPGKCSSKFS